MMIRNGCMADARSGRRRLAVWLGAIALAVLANTGEGADESFSKSWTSWPAGKRFQDVDPDLQSRLFDAAGWDDRQAVEMLLDRGMAPNAGDLLGDELIHAASRRSTAVVALLLERGVDASRRDAFGWTPLHRALLLGPGLGTSLEVASLLLKRGADVNAATRLTGWTPLHLAAHLSGYSDENEVEVEERASGSELVEMVQTLIERGANVNARTYIGGWTPLRVAKEALPTDSSKAVLAALRDAGGVDGSAPLMLYSPEKWMRFNSEREVLVPTANIFSNYFVRGSFSVPGAEERLLFERLGWNGDRVQEIVALEDRHGDIRPYQTHWPDFEDFAGLCLDNETGTHSAIFERTYEGNWRSSTDMAYYHYNTDTGKLAQAFVENWDDNQMLGPNKPCTWRGKIVRLNLYKDALRTLRVGVRPELEKDGKLGALATRAIPADVVEAQLGRLRALEGVAKVFQPKVESPHWKISVVQYVGTPDLGLADICAGVVLVWDATKEKWRSIYDCAKVIDIKMDGDRSFAAAVKTRDCSIARQSLSQPCYLEVDIATFEARFVDDFYLIRPLWEEYPEGFDTRMNRRKE